VPGSDASDQTVCRALHSETEGNQVQKNLRCWPWSARVHAFAGALSGYKKPRASAGNLA